MTITSCIFDLDGVIVDTARYHFLAWRRLARQLGFDFSASDNEQLKGVSRMKSLDILLNIGGIELSDNEREAAAQLKNRWYIEYISAITPSEILPGVTDFLKDLEKNRIKKAVGSASKNAGIIIRRLNLTDFFEVLIDGNHVTKAKPDPEIFLTVAGALKSKPQECVVFEDAQAGIAAARAGNMKSIGVGDPDVLCEADFVIRNFKMVTWRDINNKLTNKTKINID